jgi:hypothetical protein
MSTKKIKAGPNQIALFTDVGPGFPINPSPWGIGEEGASVSIVERNQGLTEVLKAFGKISQKRGLAKAAITQPRDKEIEHRYGSQTRKIVSGALKNANIAEKQSQWPFESAIGKYALVESGLLSNDEALGLAEEMFGDYIVKYAGPENRDARTAELRRLNQQTKVIGVVPSQKAS